jgi:hypothetical protein
MSTNTKKWLISAAITFVTGFAMVLLNDIDSITLDTLSDGTIVGIIFSAFRAGIKAVLELFISSKFK